MIKQTINEMRGMAEMLIPYSFPKTSISFEQDIIPLKMRDLVIDGYKLSLSFSMCIGSPPENKLETLQIEPIYYPFLPFNVVCKIAIAFLGDKFLTFNPFMINNKRLYIWTLRTIDGVRVPPYKESITKNYEGFEYFMLTELLEYSAE